MSCVDEDSVDEAAIRFAQAKSSVKNYYKFEKFEKITKHLDFVPLS